MDLDLDILLLHTGQLGDDQQHIILIEDVHQGLPHLVNDRPPLGAADVAEGLHPGDAANPSAHRDAVDTPRYPADPGLAGAPQLGQLLLVKLGQIHLVCQVGC